MRYLIGKNFVGKIHEKFILFTDRVSTDKVPNELIRAVTEGTEVKVQEYESSR